MGYSMYLFREVQIGPLHIFFCTFKCHNYKKQKQKKNIIINRTLCGSEKGSSKECEQ